MQCGLEKCSLKFNVVKRKGVYNEMWSRGKECAVQYGLDKKNVECSVV